MALFAPRAFARSLRVASLSRSQLLPTAHFNSCCAVQQRQYNKPLSANDVPRFAGLASMFRLPVQEGKPEGLDACFVGIPMDIGCSYRSGTRQGPRQIRHESSIIRYYNNVTGAAPYEALQVADIGDIPTNPYDLKKTMDIITTYYKRIMNAGCVPLGLGGDHSLTLPVLRAVSEKHGQLAMVQVSGTCTAIYNHAVITPQVDAHGDVGDTMFGEKLAHGTPFRRAIEEGLIDPTCVVQIGLRGSWYTPSGTGDFEWAKKQVTHDHTFSVIDPPSSTLLGHTYGICSRGVEHFTGTSHEVCQRADRRQAGVLYL